MIIIREKHCLITQIIKAIRQWNLVSQSNLTWKTFFLEKHLQNEVNKLVPQPFQKIKIEQSLDQLA